MVTGGMAGKGGFAWQEGDNFADLTRIGDEWEIVYGFEATAKRGRQVVARRSTPDYEDAVRQLWQVIGYYFAEPEHAERIRRDLLARAGLVASGGKYLPVPDAKFLTSAGGGAGGEDEAGAEQERRDRILRGEPEPSRGVPQGEASSEKRPWWKRFGR